MLDVAAGVADDRGIGNVSFEYADAHELPFEDDSFDLVTCRIAPHHFQDPATFVDECARVLRPGGLVGIVDNLAPEDPETATWCDDFERRRDLSHLRCLPVSEWLAHLADAGFSHTTVETMGKHMDFRAWADNMSVADDVREALLDDLRSATEDVVDWLRPDVGGNPSFVLTEGLFTARKD
ncbi:MAG: methyltransferase domain-containing protein [Actinomycetota bacterium]